MPEYHHQNDHNEDEFVQLANRSGIKSLIDKYRDRGVTFCYFEGSSCVIPGSCYVNHGDIVSQPELSEGIIYIFSDDLTKYELSKEEGFALQTFHELGHYEASKRSLDCGDENVAWDVSESIARTFYGGALPDYWARVRRAIYAKEQDFWERQRRRLEREMQMPTE